MTTETPDVVWMSTDRAAKYLGVAARTLYRFIDSGALGAYRFGRVIRLKQSELDAYIEDCRVKPGDLAHLYPESVAVPEEDE